MATKALTPQEKAEKRARDGFTIAANQVRGAWSLGLLKTWNDVFHKLGWEPSYIKQKYSPERAAATLTYLELKEFLTQQEQEMNAKLIAMRQPAPPVKEETNQPIVAQTTPQIVPPTTIDTSGKVTTPPPLTQVEPAKVAESLSKERLDTLSKQADAAIAHATKAEDTIPEDDMFNKANEYGLKVVPGGNHLLDLTKSKRAFLYWFQKKAISEALYKILVKEYRVVLVIAGTGTGKTFMQDGMIYVLNKLGAHEDKTASHIQYLVITKSSIIEQQCRVLKNTFDLTEEDGVEITNIESMRAKYGKYWIKETRKVEIVDGKEVEIINIFWKPGIQPPYLFLDEAQGVKNPEAKQTKIIHKYGALPENNTLIMLSATPGARVADFKVFACATKKPLGIQYGLPEGTVLNDGTWPAYAKYICNNGDPEEYCEAYVERLMKDLKDYIVRVKGVRPQFEADNKIQMITFRNDRERAFYDKAMDRFRRRKAKSEAAKAAGGTGENPLVILQQFSIAAEVCRAEFIADLMIQKVKEGKAACAAVKWKPTLIAIEQFLEVKGVSRDEISLIWGGGQTQMTAKQKTKAKLKQMKDKIEATGVSLDELLEDAELSDVEDRELINLPEASRLGMQNPEQRQAEIDRFQSGKSLYCIYTLKAGGVGLSLHHTDEMTEFKCRRKESGYAVEEDIPLVPTRPRFLIGTPSYSFIDLVQSLGRCPRLTSLSVTEQWMLYYAGTMEVDMADVVSQKLRCLSTVVMMRESWQDMMLGDRPKEYYLNSTAKAKTDESMMDAQSAESAVESAEEAEEDDGNGNGK